MKDIDYSRYEPIFGSWYITEEIGSGGEGSLFRIRRTDALGNEFFSALKAITIPAGGENELQSMMAGGLSREEAEGYFENALESTTQEFEMLERLKGNSNIASYEDHEIFRHEGDFGWDILIRLEELTPLVKYSVEHPLSEDEVINMATDICRGLEVCRKFHIVHRDIKPDNIFISPSGSYKLGDFGIARIIDETSGSVSRKGTYSFMAPEVYWGREYGPSIDLYSLGMVMYRYLNDGRMPFMPVYPEELKYGDGETAFLKRINGNEMPPPRNGSEALKGIVLKACAYDRKDRYKEVTEMLRDLESLRSEKSGDVRYADSVLSADVSAPATITTKNEKRRKGKRIFAFVLTVCIIAAGIIYAAIPKAVTDIEAEGVDGGAELLLGEDLLPTYTVKPDWFSSEPITFASDNDNIFTVNEAGDIHAVSVGSATLTMTARDYSETAEITVEPKVTSIDGIDKEINMTTGDKLILEPKLKPDKYADEPITYSTADDKIVAVSKKGELTASSSGETTVTISSGGSSFSTSVKVADPVIVYSSPAKTTAKKSRKSSSSGSGKSSSKASKGYFDSSDDEHF